MPIGDLSSKVSSSASEKVYNKNNPPEFESGFGDDDIDADFESLFDDLDSDDFGAPISGSSSFGSSSSGFGSTNSSFGGYTFGNSTFGSPTFGSPAFGSTTFGSPAFGNSTFGSFGQPIGQQQTEKKPDALDHALEAVGSASVSLGKLVLNIIKTAKNRNADDIGVLSKNLLITGLAIFAISFLLFLVGVAGGMSGMRSLALQTCICSMLTVGTGLAGIGGSALRIILKGDYTSQNISDMPDLNTNDSFDNESDSLSDSDYDDIFNDLFGEDQEESFDDFDFTSSKSDSFTNDSTYSGAIFDDTINKSAITSDKTPKELEEEFDKLIYNVSANYPLIDRVFLFNTFKEYFPLNTPGFSEKRDIPSGSAEFNNLEVLCTQALAAAAKKEISEIKARLNKAVSTYFCYELRMDRVKGLNKVEDIAKEIEAYFRDNADDASVVATVYIERDEYKIIVTKGVQAVVTFGDCFQLKDVCDYFLNTKNKLPIIVGIDEYGNPILADAKRYTTMLVAGKPRSGKSWFVLAILFALMTFNTPEDVQLLIIDPKESTLFKVISLMPHVCGLHNDRNILQIMEELINIEGARRKKILADNMCEDIWELRERKGIKLPILYLVIDEVMTVIANLGNGPDKEFNRLLNIIITQLPSLGICLLFVPHRAMGVVDKAARVNMAFTAAVKADEEVIKETLDIKKWDRPLTQQGDIAVKMSDMASAKYVKGVALINAKDDNSPLTILITSIAKTFYKMGVDIPDMSTIGCGYNRNEKKIREMLELTSSSKRVQFDVNDLTNVDNDDLDSLINETDFN